MITIMMTGGGGVVVPGVFVMTKAVQMICFINFMKPFLLGLDNIQRKEE
jgi:hypothetical protein